MNSYNYISTATNQAEALLEVLYLESCDALDETETNDFLFDLACDFIKLPARIQLRAHFEDWDLQKIIKALKKFRKKSK